MQIYAAMTFRPALERVVAAYQNAGGPAIAVYGPTLLLIRQLAGGTPAEIPLTANRGWINGAVRQVLVQPGTRSDLMTNDLVLARPSGSPTVGRITRTFAIGALLGDGWLAMCDPDHDPASRYAKKAFRYVRLIINGPGAWQVGMISIRLMFMCGGSPTTHAAASAMLSAVNGTVPA